MARPSTQRALLCRCAYNGFLGLLLLAGALALRLPGSPDLIGGRGFVLVVASAVVLLAALVVPVTRPRLVPAVLAAQGVPTVGRLGFRAGTTLQ